MAQQGQAKRRHSERKERERAGLLAAAAVSLLAHLALIPMILWLVDLSPKKPAKTSVRLVQMSRSAWMQNRSLKDHQKPRPQDSQKHKKNKKEQIDDSPIAPGQVVALPPSKDNIRPQQADYASEFNHKVERETRSRYQSADYLNPANKPQIGDMQRKKAASASTSGQAKIVLKGLHQGGPSGAGRSPAGHGRAATATAPAQRSQQAPSLPKQAQRDALALKQDNNNSVLQNRSYSEAIMGQADKLNLRLRSSLPSVDSATSTSPLPPGPEAARGGDGSQRRGLAALLPDPRDLQRLSGGPLNDYLPDVEQDDQTFLNAWQWKHAPFFNRIAESIRREWRPGRQLARRDPSGRIYGIEDRYTMLRITIDRSGRIQDLEVAESCGVKFLDQEAMRAFRAAQPFANPPSQLFANGDQYSFQFGFNVNFQSGSFMRFNWRPSP